MDRSPTGSFSVASVCEGRFNWSLVKVPLVAVRVEPIPTSHWVITPVFGLEMAAAVAVWEVFGLKWSKVIYMYVAARRIGWPVSCFFFSFYPLFRIEFSIYRRSVYAIRRTFSASEFNFKFNCQKALSSEKCRNLTVVIVRTKWMHPTA